MQLLNQSAFIQSLGWAIANSLWQLAALWLCYQLFTAFNKKAGPSIKNFMATLLLLTGSSWFIYGLLSKYFTLQNEVVVILQGDKIQNQATWNSLTATSGSFYSFINTASIFLEKYLPYLSAAYLLVFAFLFVRLLYAWNQSHLIKTKGLFPLQQQWAEHFIHLTEQAAIHKKVSVWLSERIDVPATLGFFKPVILLPIATINQLTPEQVETILLHELGHIKRNDYLINLLVAVSETLLFFNPFAVLLAVQLKKERENSCDDFVLRFRNQPETYAMALLALEKNRINSVPLLLKATGNDGQLLNRVKRILNIPSDQYNYRNRLVAFLVTAIIFSSIAWIKPVSKNKTDQKAFTKSGFATTLNANKIVLTPSIIEKNPAGDIVLFDAQKKNSLRVKVENNKIKLIDDANNSETLADDFEMENLQKQKEAVFERIQANDFLTYAETPDAPAADGINEKSFPRMKSFVVPEFPAAKVEQAFKNNRYRRVENEQMKKAMEEFKKINLVKEWENLPTKEDWAKMQHEITLELGKLQLQLQLNQADLSKLDSAMSMATIFIPMQPVNFNAARERKKLQLKSLTRLKAFVNNNSYVFVTPDNEEMMAMPGDTDEITAVLKKDTECTTGDTGIRLYRQMAPPIKISQKNKISRKSKVIVSL